MTAIEIAEAEAHRAWARVLAVLSSPVLFLLAMDAHAEACNTRNRLVIARNAAMGL